MFDYRPSIGVTKSELYREMTEAAKALTAREPDPVANMANLSALLAMFLSDVNWCGFYRLVNEELVLGPFIGKPACIRIPLGTGVCGVAAQNGETQCVADVREFPGHIACDADTLSELVVPVGFKGNVIAVIDCDSPVLARFDASDVKGMQSFATAIAPVIAARN